MSNILENFTDYVERGVVPAKLREGVEEPSFPLNNKEFAPKNCFFKSLHCIDEAVVGLIKDALFGVKRHFLFYDRENKCIYTGARNNNITGIIRPTVFALTNIVLQPLYLAFAYLSYWPAKGLAKITDKFDLKNKTESFAGYSNMLSNKAEKHSKKVAGFINTVLNYAFTAVIWTVALVPTPAVWLYEKVSSKLGETKAPEPAKDKDTGAEAGAATAMS